MDRNFSQRHQAGIVFFLATLVFLPTVQYSSFVLDDVIHLESNSLLTSASGWANVLREPVYPGNLYRPITFLTFWIESFFLGLHPWHFHLINSVLHAICSVLVLLLLSRLSSARIAFASAVLFAVHPVHTEAVTTIVGRAELLAFLFGVSGILCVRTQRFAMAVLLFILSSLSKESGVLFPVLGSVLYLGEEHRKFSFQSFLLGVPAGVFAMLLRSNVLGGLAASTRVPFLDNPLASLEWWERILHAIVLLGRYLALCFVPFPIGGDYSFAEIAPQNFLDLTTNWGVIVAMAVLALFGILLSLERNIAGIATLWFFVAFAITGNILFPIGTGFADRLLYTPSLGPILVLALVVNAFRNVPFRIMGCSIIVVLFSLLTVFYQHKWSHRNALFDWQGQITPKSVRTMINLAGVYRNQGDFHQAFTLAERAHSLYPDGAEPLFMMATIALENGEKGKMRSLLEETLQKAPTFVPALVALGRVCLNDKDFECAKATLEKAVNEEPRNVRALVSRYALAIANGDVVFARELEHRIEKLAIRDAEYFQLKSRFHIAIGHRS